MDTHTQVATPGVAAVFAYVPRFVRAHRTNHRISYHSVGTAGPQQPV